MAKKKTFNAMSLDELKKELIDLEESLLNLRFQKSLQQLEDPLQLKSSKKNIARIKTFIRQNELGLKK